MGSNRLFAIWLLLLLQFNLSAAESFWIVYFTDKGDAYEQGATINHHFSHESLVRRAWQGIEFDWHDYPVHSTYTDILQMGGYSVKGISRWLNAALVTCEDAHLDVLKGYPFVQSVIALGYRGKVEKKSRDEYKNNCLSPDSLLTLLNAHFLTGRGQRGQGMSIAILDVGFAGADTIKALRHLFNRDNSSRETRVFDFTGSDMAIFSAFDHGTKVLSLLAGRAPEVAGLAPEATYTFYRTEVLEREHPLEEFYLVQALEHADSLGAWAVNVSLGYTLFDEKKWNFTKEDLNGKSSIASIAAAKAAGRGMLFVTSAGNEALLDWKYVSIPADADSILSVAAVLATGQAADFSSYSPDSSRAVPNISAPGVRLSVLDAKGQVACSFGTSYAAPLISGAAAALWQAYPEASAYQVREAILQSGKLFPQFKDRIGYGLPDFAKADAILSNSFGPLGIRAKWLPLVESLAISNDQGATVVYLEVSRVETQEIIHAELFILESWQRFDWSPSHLFPKGQGDIQFKLRSWKDDWEWKMEVLW
jgi:serine protease AprX